jgi:hypothetical protein
MAIENWDNYASHSWAWGWLRGAFPQNVRIMPSDRDGFVHVDSYLLFIDGKVTKGFGPPSVPDEIMVKKAKNVTCLYLHADPNTWEPDLDDHEPKEITHYFLNPGPWPAESWARNMWAKTTKADVWFIVCQWATWAQLKALGQ